MNRREIRKQFGRRVPLEAVLIYAIQHALKGYRITHPDSKRQRKARNRAIAHRFARHMKLETAS